MLLLTNFFLFLTIFASSINFLLNSYSLKYFTICKSDFLSLLQSSNCINFILSRLIFLDLKNFLIALYLITTFRNFEKIYGSKKFFNYMFSNFVLSAIFEFYIIKLLSYLNIVNLPYLANGCFSAISSLFINYCKDIPRVKFDFFGINISEKILTYFLGIQFLFSNVNIFIACLSGLLSGLICRSNTFNVCDYIKFPNKLLNFILECLNKISIKLSPIQLQPNTSTNQDTMQNSMELQSNNFINFQSNVFILEEMGFNRNQAEQALIKTKNDLNRASLILLE